MQFDITSLQRNRGVVQAKSRADEQAGRATLKYIDVYDLIPSEDNFYAMSAIEELAALIEVSGGVKQPGLVVPLGGGKYKVIAGHRRRLASIFLVEQGKEQYRKMPCMVEETSGEKPEDPEEAAEAAEIREIDEGILLIATNGQREKTDWERVQEVTRLRALLERKRQHQKIPGQTRKIIAEQLGTTPAQVGRYESIAKHLTPDFQAEFAAGRVNVSTAYELSTLPEEEQADALEEYRQRGGAVPGGRAAAEGPGAGTRCGRSGTAHPNTGGRSLPFPAGTKGGGEGAGKTAQGKAGGRGHPGRKNKAADRPPG